MMPVRGEESRPFTYLSSLVEQGEVDVVNNLWTIIL